jgi:DNA-3-methyladenine glycosylase II
VSLASGAAVFRRLEEELGQIDTEAILLAGTDGLRRVGITRQKASYCVGVASAITEGRLDLDRVGLISIKEARLELRQIRGVGPWTSDVYLLMAVRHRDIWPEGDVALHTALQKLGGLSHRPSVDEAAAYAERWTPWRAVAARILWHGYLCGLLR